MKIYLNERHGMTRTTEYTIYHGIKQRCFNVKDESYPAYGGRGITVCARWVESFKNFIADMGMRPSKNHSIDRIDNDKGYSPDNCRWATNKVQSRNKRSNRIYTVDGITCTVMDHCLRLGLDHATVSSRIKRGYTLEESFTHARKPRRINGRQVGGKNNINSYKGVVKSKKSKKFEARIYLNQKSTYIGVYPTKEEAALAYNEAALKHFGEGAYLNEIKEVA